MAWTLERDDLDALELGLALLGGGGGGETEVFGRLLRANTELPIELVDVGELDPGLSCLAVGIVGSTILLGERLPADDAADAAIEAVERWLGAPAAAMCGVEHAGLNGLIVPAFAGARHAVDADLMGRALPRIDQFSLYLDDVPDLVLALATGSGGVAMLDGARPADAEVVVRQAILSAGGWAVLVVGGFRVGDLAVHGLGGTLARALRLGRALERHGPRPAAVEGEGRWLGTARIVAIDVHPAAAAIVDVQLRGPDGDVVRLVGASEFNACFWNGARVAGGADIVAVIDVWRGRPLQLPALRVGQVVALVAIDAHPWWRAAAHRVERAGLDALEAVAP
ncbi:MAG: DUF917 family protein [Microbacterium sp.]|uniref:S-methyl thiohydantoin desulfurase domain-containing protein n=1 Tax=Microbacterium sp. TaxID=51671 RepID=UPI0039E39AE0